MIELTIVTSLVHPELFSLAWIGLIAVCIWKIIQQKAKITYPVRIWLLAFGPLLLLSIISVAIHRLSLSRIEVLEVIFGGALLTAGLPLIKTQTKAIGWSLIFSGVGALCVTIYSLWGTEHHRAGMLFQPINFGIGCGIIAIVLLGWWRFRAIVFADRTQLVLLLGVGAALLSLIGSGSRGPLVAFIACMIPAGVFWAKYSRSAKLLWLGGMTVLLITSIFVFFQRAHLEGLSGNLTSHGIRWHLVQLTIDKILDVPFIGIGADQAGKFFAQFSEPIGGLNHAHNTALNAALELGVFGAAAWIWAFGVLVWFFWMHRGDAKSVSWQLGLLITLFIFLCSLTQDVMSHSYTRRLFTFFLALLMVMSTKNQTFPNHGQDQN